MSVGSRMRCCLKTPPKKFQIQAVRFLEKNKGRGILGDSMGLGKTYEALAWMAIRPDVTRAVVVCPSNIKYQWQRQFQEHAGLQSEVLEGKKPYTPHQPLIIINYSILATATWPNGRGKGKRPRFPWVQELKKMDPQLLIIDEFHYIKNRSALRTKACVSLGRKRPHIISASGTPIEKCPAEFFPILNLTAPGAFKSFLRYAFKFCDPKRGFQGHWDFTGADNLEELHEQVRPWMIRRLKIDVAKELPPKTRTTLPVPLTNRREYQQAEDDFLGWMEDHHGEEAAERAAGAVALTRLGTLKRIAAEGKVKALQSWVEDFLEQSDEKLIMFCIHRRILAAFQKAFPTAATISGSVPAQKRQAQIDRFQKDSRCRVFLGQLRAAGVGVDGLQRVSSTVLFSEMGWNFSQHEQAEDRALRLGQASSSINAYYAVAHNTVEERILEIIQSKADICNRVLNGDIRNLDLFKRRTDEHQLIQTAKT